MPPGSFYATDVTQFEIIDPETKSLRPTVLSSLRQPDHKAVK